MWKRWSAHLRCPQCRARLELDIFSESHIPIEETARATAIERGIALQDFMTHVDEGQMRCVGCKVRYPIIDGLPVMLPYETRSHREFQQKWGQRFKGAESQYAFASMDPAPGESFVRESFSTEWLEYDYDGVIWELDYVAHQARFHQELGAAIDSSQWFLEVGCGLGLATSVAQSCCRGDCVGMDLSLAVSKAARHFRRNPFMHFVQASAFAPPFDLGQFDILYSRGVLHHTYSTKAAFESVAPLCKPGGTFFLWLYGPGSIKSTPLRLGLFALEALTRPTISRAPHSILARSFLGLMAVGYIAFNRMRRIFNRAVQPLTWRRAVHAARDRFTPRFAHRHSAEEIVSWFRSNKFQEIAVLDWRKMPPADQDDFRRNVGVRAVRSK